MADGDARLVHRLRITRHQGMPPAQALALHQHPVGACRRQPGKLLQVLIGQNLTIWHEPLAVFIASAAASFQIQEATRDIRVEDLAGSLMFQLVKAATPAAVAQPLPFGFRHFSKGLAPPVGQLVNLGFLERSEHAVHSP